MTPKSPEANASGGPARVICVGSGAKPAHKSAIGIPIDMTERKRADRKNNRVVSRFASVPKESANDAIVDPSH